MFFKCISLLIYSIYRSAQEENKQWDNIVDKLHDECILSIERYDQMGKRFDDAKFFMQSLVYKNIIDKQKKDLKNSSIMCSINQEQSEKSSQTMTIDNQSQLIDDIISKFEQCHLNLNKK